MIKIYWKASLFTTLAIYAWLVAGAAFHHYYGICWLTVFINELFTIM